MHVVCTTCWELNAEHVSYFNSVNVYPNPADGKVAVSFHLKNSAAVNVSLTNAMGQVVATEKVGAAFNGTAVFNTASLPSGVYFYTVEANGQRETGRVAVTH